MNFENIYQQLNSKGINACFNKKGDSITVFDSNKNEIATIESMPSDKNKANLIIGEYNRVECDIAYINRKQDADTLISVVQIVKPYLN